MNEKQAGLLGEVVGAIVGAVAFGIVLITVVPAIVGMLAYPAWACFMWGWNLWT